MRHGPRPAKLQVHGETGVNAAPQIWKWVCMATIEHPYRQSRRVVGPGSTQIGVRPRPWLAAGLVAIGAALVAVAILGPLATGVVDYRVTETLRNQTIGLDVVSLALVSPLAVIAAALVLRGRIAGFVLATAIGVYTSYMFLQYILGPDYASLPGNNERLFPICLFLFAAGWIVALGSWRAASGEALPGSGRPSRRIGVALGALGFVAFVRYVPALVDWTSGSPQDAVYLAGPGFAWTIATLDLGVFLPATVAACIGLVRGERWAEQLAYAVAGWFGLVGAAVAAMAVTMAVNGDPNASGGNTAFMIALGVAFVLLALVVYSGLLPRGVSQTRRSTE